MPTARIEFEDLPDGRIGIDLTFSGGAGPDAASNAHVAAALVFERATGAAPPPAPTQPPQPPKRLHLPSNLTPEPGAHD